MIRAIRHAGVAALLSVLGARLAGAQPATAVDLRVMSVNVRVGSAPDGENQWERRKAILADTILRYNPDLLGTQEALDYQVEFLAQELKGHTAFGAGRDDGQRRGEHVAIFYRADRFDVLESGHYWLSPQPDSPGTIGWDAAVPRMVSWLKLRVRGTEGPTILFQNTQWDAKGVKARTEAAKAIRALMIRKGRDAVHLLTGDFNVERDSEPFGVLASVRDGGQPLFDTYRRFRPEPGKEEGTVHDFSGKRNQKRYDWILCSSGFTVKDAAIDRSNVSGRYPSHHFPVTAVLRLEVVGTPKPD